jgi:hypothetical protein
MNCLNRYELQQYIDKEVSDAELKAFEWHLKQCETCRTLYIAAKEEIALVDKVLSINDLSENDIVVPVFRKPGINKQSWILSFSAAASLAILIGIYFTLNNKLLKSRQINKSELEVEQLLYQSDPNKLWNDKQPIITVTDEKGEIIYSSINN